ncbi:P-loop ATPase, Sll1717 family [Alkaliphilus hydrothermalis]|uniref:AAA domain-containing protein n=1 Tax=Alkaliphilus hydrothermalis TaxID=1482730 RepID=A0ABS2NR54_9FIRM|nr:AAA family ATPase [Alkaliphilus hydrothermalis]MBM7615418.1 hypothetical protein [Alkaliphilus hydrothermalis]
MKTVHFDEVYELLHDKLTIIKHYNNVTFYIIRDVFGRISIYILKEGEDSELINFVTNIIKEAIGEPWLNTVEQVFKGSRFLDKLRTITKKINDTDNIYYGERHLTRLNWFRKKMQIEEIQSVPKVITFYSFKGGLGRTTSMVLTALQLVRQGKKVVMVDFDLEAPGLSSVLLPENNQFPEYGVVDYLIESQIYLNTNYKLDIDEYVYTIQDRELIGSSGGQLYVVPASNLKDENTEVYLEKMGRLDFNTPTFMEENNPISMMITQLSDRFKPDYIFLDARTGIHDVGGLTLTQFADLAFLLFYGNDQNMAGMKMVLPKVIENKIPFFLINSPVPISEDEADEEIDFYLENAYNLLVETNYYEEGKLPDLYEENAEHYPYLINYQPQAVLLNTNKKIANLLDDNGKSNVYFKLAEQIASYGNEREISELKIDIKEDNKSKMLEGISQITGKVAASENEFKSDEDLIEKFYPLKEHRFIFESDKFLILGPKGSGKTALFSVLEHRTYAKYLAAYLGVSTESFDRTIWITGLKQSADFPTSDSFEIIGQKKEAFVHRRFWQLLALRSLAREVGEELNFVPSEVKENLESISNLRELAENLERAEEVEGYFHILDQQLQERNQNIILVYDALDVLLKNRDIRGSMISALIGLWHEYLPRYKNIRVKIFLRDDIFNKEVNDLTDKVKLRNFSEKLSWTYDELLAMVWKRMAQKSNEVAELFKDVYSSIGLLMKKDDYLGYIPKADVDINKAILKVLVGERMASGKAAFSYNWIRNHLADTNERIVPRSILKLFAFAAEKNLEKIEIFGIYNNIVRPKMLDSVMNEVSIDRVDDLLDEYKEFEAIFNNLKEFLPRFPANEDDLKEALRKCGVPEGKEINTIAELVDIGVMKPYQRKKSDPIRYHIPDIFLIGLGLSRVGLKAKNK